MIYRLPPNNLRRRTQAERRDLQFWRTSPMFCPIQPLNRRRKGQNPAPICIREKTSNSFVNSILEPLGMITSTLFSYQKVIFMRLVQVKHEDMFRILTKYLDDNKINYYTYHLKSSKGQQVVTKGIKADVQPTEVAHVLRENGFEVKRRPYPLIKVELLPALKALKKNEMLPIYKLPYYLQCRAFVEEPHKRNGPV